MHEHRISRRRYCLALGGAIAPHLWAQSPSRRGIISVPTNDAKPTVPEFSSGPSTRRRMALVIGNNNYSNATPLRNAIHDAEDLTSKLQQLGFEVTMLQDASLNAGRGAVRDFTRGLHPGDTSLFYYSGHGLQIGGENYIVPVEFNPDAGGSNVATVCLPTSEVRGLMEKSGSQLNILILDACRNNPFGSGAARGLALMEAELGTCVALATGPGQTASDNPAERNGLFTRHLLEEMGRPGQSLEALLHRVKQQVFDISKGKQRPWSFVDVVGDFYFAGEDPSFIPSAQASTLVERGKVEFVSGRLEDAARTFDSAIRIDPENPFCYNALGAVRARLRQPSIAVGLYSRAIELRPDYAAAYFNRGVAYYNAARYELALQDFSWAVDQEPFDPRSLDLRGKTHLALRSHESALADFDRALQLDPTDATAFAGRGRVYFRQGHYSDSIRELTQALALKVEADTLDSRSQAYRAVHQSAQADADARRAALLRSRR